MYSGVLNYGSRNDLKCLKFDSLLYNQTEFQCISELQKNITLMLTKLIGLRDESTAKHALRTAAYVKYLSNEVYQSGFYLNEFREEHLEYLYIAALLHDIGKVAVPDIILNKEDKLTDAEFEVIKLHTVNGETFIRNNVKDIMNQDFIEVASIVARSHHEKWNGRGYPDKLNGKNIPLAARIMSIADVFDALTSSRSYKQAFPLKKTIDIMRNESGKSFEPMLIDLFLDNPPFLLCF